MMSRAPLVARSNSGRLFDSLKATGRETRSKNIPSEALLSSTCDRRIGSLGRAQQVYRPRERFAHSLGHAVASGFSPNSQRCPRRSHLRSSAEQFVHDWGDGEARTRVRAYGLALRSFNRCLTHSCAAIVRCGDCTPKSAASLWPLRREFSGRGAGVGNSTRALSATGAVFVETMLSALPTDNPGCLCQTRASKLSRWPRTVRRCAQAPLASSSAAATRARATSTRS